MLENVKTIRGDFNNGGVGFAGKDDLVNNFNEKTGVLKEQMHATADKIREDEDASNIIFNEDDLESTDNKKAVDDLNNDTDATSGASEDFDEDDAKQSALKNGNSRALPRIASLPQSGELAIRSKHRELFFKSAFQYSVFKNTFPQKIQNNKK